MSGLVLHGVDALATAAGKHLGPSEWLTITPTMVSSFLAATGAKADDFVPPLMLLSLTNRLLPELLEVRGIAAGVNYGTGSVVFPAPVPVGAALRASADIVSVADAPGGVQAVIRITVEVRDRIEMACVVDSMSRYHR